MCFSLHVSRLWGISRFGMGSAWMSPSCFQPALGRAWYFRNSEMLCFSGQFSFLTSFPGQGCAWPIRAAQQGMASGTAGSGVLGRGWPSVRECWWNWDAANFRVSTRLFVAFGLVVAFLVWNIMAAAFWVQSQWKCSWEKIVIRVTQQTGSFQAASFRPCWLGSLDWPGCLPQLWDFPGALTAVLGTVGAWASCWSSLTVLACVFLQGTHLSTVLH